MKKICNNNNILIVDDHPNNLMILTSFLTDNGYNVQSATSGKMALRTINTKKPDLILLDIMMPEMDGFEVIKLIREQKHTSNIPIIFVTSIHEVQDKIKGFQLGAVDYITKPFESAEVLARVKVHLSIRDSNLKLEESKKQLELAQAELKQLNAELTDRVQQRTSELETANLALKKSEERFRAFLEDTEDLVTQVDNEGNFLYVNHASTKIFGLSPDNCIGKSAFSFMHEADRTPTQNWFQECIDKKIISSQIENRQVHVTGKIFDMAWISRFYYDENGKLLYINSIARDITRRVSEEKLRLAQLRLIEKPHNLSPDKMLQLFLDETEILTKSQISFCHFIYEDQESLRLKAWSTNTRFDFCTQKPDTTHYPISKAGIWVDCIHYKKPIIHNDYQEIPHRKGLPEGHPPIMRELVVPVFRDKKIVAIMGVGNKPFDYNEEDINIVKQMAELAWESIVRFQTENALKQSENKFRSYVEYAPDGIFVVNESGVITDVNTAACKMIGFSRKDFIGTSAMKCVYSDDATIASLHADSLRKHGKASDVIRFVTKNDAIRSWLVNSVRLENEKSLIFASDITEQQQYELQLNQYEKMEAVGQLASGMAHDFNNQLTGIMGFAQLLNYELEKDNSNILASYAQNIIYALFHASDLSRQLLNFSRRENLLTIPVDLHGTIDEVVNLLMHSISKNIKIEKRLGANISTIIGDPGLLQSVFLNLGLNARDAMPDGGKLIFATQVVDLDSKFFKDPANIMAPGPYLSIDVMDTGIGMDEKTVNRIFEPFYTTKKKSKGTGMGLAVVYSTIKNFKGFISVSSVPNQGTTFHIYFPIIGKGKVKEYDLNDLKPVPGQEHILFIDDENIICQIVPMMLENLGYQVSICKNGFEAVDFYNNNWQTIDLFILDVMMPEMSGKEAFDAMHEINPDIIVLISTGLSHEGDVQKMIQAGAKGVLKKPFNVGQISQKIHEVLSERTDA